MKYFWLIFCLLGGKAQPAQYQSALIQTITSTTNHILLTSNIVGRVICSPQIFANQFTSLPQVLMIIPGFGFGKGNNGFSIEAKSIQINGFTAQLIALSQLPVYTLLFQYFAVVDENIQINTKYLDYRLTGQMSPDTYIQFQSYYICQWNFDKSTCKLVILFQSTIIQVSQTQVQVQLCYDNCPTIKYYLLAILSGSSNHLQAGIYSQTPVLYGVQVILGTLNLAPKYYVFGINGIAIDESQNTGIARLYISQTIQNNQIAYTSIKAADTTLTNQTLSYFLYTTCVGYCNYCIGYISDQCNQCISTTFRSNPPYCNCQQSYFQDGSNITCQRCSTKCLSCISEDMCTLCKAERMTINPPNCNTCITECTISITHVCIVLHGVHLALLYNVQCAIISVHPVIQLDVQLARLVIIQVVFNAYLAQNIANICLSCINSNQFVDANQQCIECHSNCLSCSSHGGQTCQPNYQLNSFNQCIECSQDQCLDCSGKQAITTQACLYVNCSDGVWSYGEQCDNQGDYKSGCSECKVSPGFICENTLQEPSYCIPLLNNCQQGIIVNSQSVCLTCQYNYLLIDDSCLKCAEQCLGCIKQLDLCVSCKFTNLNNINCQLCESQMGSYSDFINNACYTICGDGIAQGYEKCDLENGQFDVGCNNCQIESGYSCDSNMCYKIVYPTPILQEIPQYPSLYNNQKIFQMSYNIPIKSNITAVTQIFIDQVNFTYYWITIDQTTYNLIISLKTECVNKFILINILNDEIISQDILNNLNNYKWKSLIILDYNISSRVNIKVHKLYFYYIDSIGVISLAFWRYLSILELIGSHASHFIFQIFQYYFAVQSIKFLEYIQHFLNIEFTNKQYLYFYSDQYFWYQQSPIKDFIRWIHMLNYSELDANFKCLHIQFYCLFSYNLCTKNIQQHQISTIIAKFTSYKIYNYCSKIQYFLFRTTQKMLKQKISNVMIRIVQSSAYDIGFMIVLAIYGLSTSESSIEISINQLLTIFTIVGYLIILYTFSYISGLIQTNSNVYEAIYTDIKIRPLTIYYSFYMIIKKLIFMISLVLFYSIPLFQVTGVVICSMVHIIFIIILDPIVSMHEKIKQYVCEIYLVSGELFILLLVLDDYDQLFTYKQRDYLGWFTISAIIFIILTQLIIDSYQQLVMYYRNYMTFRTIVKKIKGLLSQQ